MAGWAAVVSLGQGLEAWDREGTMVAGPVAVAAVSSLSWPASYWCLADVSECLANKHVQVKLGQKNR